MKASTVLTYVITVLQIVLLLLSIISALKGIGVLTIGEGDCFIDIYPVVLAEKPSVAGVGTQILNTLYQIFKYVIYGVIVISGIETALGLVANFLKLWLPIRIPGRTVNYLIRNILGLLIIKSIVDGALKYFGWTPPTAQIAVLYLYGYTLDLTWFLSIILGVLIGVKLAERASP